MRATIDTTGDTSLGYILDRLNNIHWAKRAKVFDDFREVYPKNTKEAKKWLEEKNFHLNTSDDEFEYFEFRWGPTVDTAKRDTMLETLEKVYTDTKDTVHVVTDETARLKALKDFESFTVN